MINYNDLLSIEGIESIMEIIRKTTPTLSFRIELRDLVVTLEDLIVINEITPLPLKCFSQDITYYNKLIELKEFAKTHSVIMCDECRYVFSRTEFNKISTLKCPRCGTIMMLKKS